MAKRSREEGGQDEQGPTKRRRREEASDAFYVYYGVPWKHGASTLGRLCEWTSPAPMPTPPPRYIIQVTEGDVVQDALVRAGGPWRIEQIVGPFSTADLAADYAHQWRGPPDASSSHPRRLHRARELAVKSAPPPPPTVWCRSRKQGGATRDEERAVLPADVIPLYDAMLERTKALWLDLPSFLKK